MGGEVGEAWESEMVVIYTRFDDACPPTKFPGSISPILKRIASYPSLFEPNSGAPSSRRCPITQIGYLNVPTINTNARKRFNEVK